MGYYNSNYYASTYYRATYYGIPREVELGDLVVSKISVNAGAVSSILTVIDIESPITTSDYCKSFVFDSLYCGSDVCSDTVLSSDIKTDYRGRVSGFGSDGKGLVSGFMITEGLISDIDIIPTSAISAIDVTGSGRVGAINTVFDTIGTIDNLTPIESDIGIDSIGIMSVLR